jgi:glycosyltransferase involved in cell wall biosynthesis
MRYMNPQPQKAPKGNQKMAANPIVLGNTGPLGRPRGRADAGLSIVVPVYNEAGNLPGLHTRIVEVATALHNNRRLVTEVIYVDDGSRDDTLAVARGLSADKLDVQVISLSRNFGKEAALLAGLDHTRLGAVLFMDGDGQHPPSLVETLVGHWLDGGYDVVYTAKAHRENESWLRRMSVRGFYSIINWGAPQDPGGCRRLPPALPARRRRAASAPRAQPLLQGARQLDRLPTAARRL